MLAYLFHNPLQCNQLHKCNHICLRHLHRYHHFDMDCWHIHRYLIIKHTLSWILFYAYSSQFDLIKCYTVVNCFMLTYLFHNPLQCNQLHKCNHICLHHLHRYHHFDMDCLHIHRYLSIKQTLSWILFYAYSSQFDLKKCCTVVSSSLLYVGLLVSQSAPV